MQVRQTLDTPICAMAASYTDHLHYSMDHHHNLSLNLQLQHFGYFISVFCHKQRFLDRNQLVGTLLYVMSLPQSVANSLKKPISKVPSKVLMVMRLQLRRQN